MTKINGAWYTREVQVFPLTYKLTKEQIKNDQEIDQNMENVSQHVMDRRVVQGGRLIPPKGLRTKRRGQIV